MSYRQARQSAELSSFHKFAVRQPVKLNAAHMLGALRDDAQYEITRIMPREDDGKLFYRIKAEGRPERVVQEFQLIAAGGASAFK